MARYLLMYAEPHAALDGSAISYQAVREPAEHFNNQTALHWAREEIPRQKAALFAEHAHLAKPLVLWRVDDRGGALVWEDEPGIALRFAR